MLPAPKPSVAVAVTELPDVHVRPSPPPRTARCRSGRRGQGDRADRPGALAEAAGAVRVAPRTEKNSRTNSPSCADGTVSEPVTVVTLPDRRRSSGTGVSAGGRCRRCRASPFGVTPSPFAPPPAATRSMPTPTFASMRLPRIETRPRAGADQHARAAVVHDDVPGDRRRRRRRGIRAPDRDPGTAVAEVRAIASGGVPIALHVTWCRTPARTARRRHRRSDGR